MSRTRTTTIPAEIPNRIPPHDLAAEAAVLGGCLLEAAILERAAVKLEPEDFYTEAHRTIYRRMLDLHEAQSSVGLITLTDALRASHELEAAGGPAALALLVEQGAIPSLVDDYLRIILVHAGARRDIQVLTQALQAAYDGTAPAELATSVTDALTQIAERTDGEALREKGRHGEPPKPVRQVLRSILEALDTPESDFVTCPHHGVNDRLGGGLLRGEMLTLGGRPGVAKSALIVQWAIHVAQRGQSVLLVSQEMNAAAIGRRILAQQTRTSATSLRRRDVDPHDWPKLLGAMDRLEDLPLWIDDSKPTLNGLRRRLRERAYRLVIVDYLQLLRAPEHRDRRLEVSAVSAGLKRLASWREGCSVIALSSLTRLYQDKGKKVERPGMDKLKESGDVEADSDAVLILHWPDTEQSERELIFAKVRDGEGGGAPLLLDFEPAFVKFTIPDEAPPQPTWVLDGGR